MRLNAVLQEGELLMRLNDDTGALTEAGLGETGQSVEGSLDERLGTTMDAAPASVCDTLCTGAMTEHVLGVTSAIPAPKPVSLVDGAAASVGAAADNCRDGSVGGMLRTERIPDPGTAERCAREDWLATGQGMLEAGSFGLGPTGKPGAEGIRAPWALLAGLLGTVRLRPSRTPRLEAPVLSQLPGGLDRLGLALSTAACVFKLLPLSPEGPMGLNRVGAGLEAAASAPSHCEI